MSHRPDALDFTTLEGSTTMPEPLVRAAAITVCRHATSHTDARHIMNALGIVEGDHLAALAKVRPLWPWTQHPGSRI